MKKVWILVLALLVSASLIAQEQPATKIEFQETTHDFGTVKKGDKTEHTFIFTNTSNEPVKLTRVKASCGCTTPKWTSAEVKPNETGEIQVKYNSNRIGRFTKSITVNYDSSARPIILYIKGEVENMVANTDARFPNRVGMLGFDKTLQNIGILDSDKEFTATFKVKNLGPLPITFTGEVDKEIMFDVKPSEERLIPGQVGTIEVVVKGDRFITYGQFNKTIKIYTDDKETPVKALNINGNVKRVYSQEELAAMPQIEFEQTEYDGGVVIEGEKVTYAYKFTNTGQTDLEIENVRASCGCTASSPKDKVIKPGQTSEITATFNSTGRLGLQQKSITVRSNDPDNGTVVLRLKVTVEKDPFHQEEVGPAATPGTQR